eukprot:CAMPEP_0174832912 /NCGR_PEP_ID=MMETSP1114-20130205/3926_1 /TAXON_ID=312471 /ORGANISM="Neobodo designis, Strain CCAP 1951/1" /LENGTH=59 /DNA_ID=CAMNT_0016066779 /DNA_START=66 /DNA_END=242 /DNA_ORIENTATION=+
MSANARLLARPSLATPFNEFPPALHEDTYVPFLRSKALPRVRCLCANAANAATTHMRDV